MVVICEVSTHGEVVDHGGADDCHLYFGRDLGIVDGTAEVGVDPVNEELLFLDFPVRVSSQEFLLAGGKLFFAGTPKEMLESSGSVTREYLSD